MSKVRLRLPDAKTMIKVTSHGSFIVFGEEFVVHNAYTMSGEEHEWFSVSHKTTGANAIRNQMYQTVQEAAGAAFVLLTNLGESVVKRTIAAVSNRLSGRERPIEPEQAAVFVSPNKEETA